MQLRNCPEGEEGEGDMTLLPWKLLTIICLSPVLQDRKEEMIKAGTLERKFSLSS